MNNTQGDNGMSADSVERFRRVDALFDAALERSEPERAAFLASACGDDESLRREVEALLETARTAESWLGEHVGEFASPLLDSLYDDGPGSSVLAPGTYVGAWKIERAVGRGGMGDVYLAFRNDAGFTLRAAVKVVRGGMDSASAVRRFHEERRILAGLDHPNIARLLDGGAAADGAPWLAMEYVEGQAIDAWCDARRASVRERIERFRTVCLAVHHAHRNLVVHHDVKPSNIFVTSDGTPKLLDFGIARLLEEPDQDEARPRTVFRALTPEYAAPEQVMDQPVTTATDVYGLGLVLYELLAGCRPYDVSGLGFAEAARVVREQEPPPPSEAVKASAAKGQAEARATTPARLSAELRGDLDTIVLRALAKEPGRRYGSALQLAEDLERYLAGQPVTARPDTLGYRTSKFLRRHRIGASAAAAFVLVLIAFAASMAAAQRRTARALEAAELEREKAEEVAQFLEGLFTAANPLGERPERLDTVRAAALLERGVARANAELSDRPVLRATLLGTIGQTYVGMGRYEAADSLLRRSVELLREDGSDRLELADALSALGVLGLTTDRPAEAEPLFREAAAIRRAMLPPDDARIPGILGNLAASLQDQNRFDDAVAVYDSALALVRAAPAQDSARLYVLLNGRANLAFRTGQMDTAAALLREVIAIQRERVGEEHPTFLNELANLAALLRNSGRPEEAEPIQREVTELTLRQLGPDHPRTVFGMIALAQNVALLGRRDEAEPLFDQAIAAARRVLGPRSSDLARALSLYGDMLAAGGDTARAAVHAEESWRINTAAFGPVHPASGLTRTKFANFRCALGEQAEAVAHYREALVVLDSVSPPNDPWPTQARIGLGQCLTRMTRFQEAEATLLGAWESANGVPALQNQIPAVARRLVALYEAWGRPEAAAPYRTAAQPAR